MCLIIKVRRIALVIICLCLVSCFTSPQSNPIPDNPITRVVQLISVSNNHGHDTVDLSANDIENVWVKTYHLSGGDHIHDFYMTQTDLEQLLDNVAITIDTRINNRATDHQHTIQLAYIEPD